MSVAAQITQHEPCSSSFIEQLVDSYHAYRPVPQSSRELDFFFSIAANAALSSEQKGLAGTEDSEDVRLRRRIQPLR
ncbi:hypothetical protein HUW63_25855 [Myxococcus sp. AM001]|nr:hypothetical protein [Myxococcus sp. AM001]